MRRCQVQGAECWVRRMPHARCTDAERAELPAAPVPAAGCRVPVAGDRLQGASLRRGVVEMMRVVAVGLSMVTSAAGVALQAQAGSRKRRRWSASRCLRPHRFPTRRSSRRTCRTRSRWPTPRTRRCDDLDRAATRVPVALPGRHRAVHQGHRALPERSALLPAPWPSLHHGPAVRQGGRRLREGRVAHQGQAGRDRARRRTESRPACRAAPCSSTSGTTSASPTTCRATTSAPTTPTSSACGYRRTTIRSSPPPTGCG